MTDTATIVTLWGTYGTGTDEIATKLAEVLGVPMHRGAYSSDELKAAVMSPTDDPNADSWYLVQALPPGGNSKWRTIFRGVQQAQDQVREKLIAEVKEDAKRGGVFVGRNATYILRDYPNALHVRLDGPIEKRVARIVARQNLDQDQAQENAIFEDEVRAGMSIALFNWDPRQDEHYDLAVFTTNLEIDEVVNVIAGAVRAKLAN